MNVIYNDLIDKEKILQLSKEKLAQASSDPFYRQLAWQQMDRLPFPHRDHELWRQTNLKVLQDRTFNFAAVESSDSCSAIFDREKELPLLFIDGALRESFQNEQIDFLTIDSALEHAEHGPWLKTLLAQEKMTDGLKALNRGLHQQGYLLAIKEKAIINKIVHIQHRKTSRFADRADQPFLIIRAGQSAQVCVLEQFHAEVAEQSYLTNAVTNIFAEENSHVEYIKVENESGRAVHFGHSLLQAQKNATLNSFVLTLGGELSRTSIDATCAAEGSKLQLNGLYRLSHMQQGDHYSVLTHAAPHSESSQYYKGILRDEAHGVFRGKVVVEPNAQKIASTQLNRNLLISKKAHIDTQPQLEIYADDVKCTHGATIGQVSDEELFYLQSRGISPERAQELLSHAFAYDVIMRIENAHVRELCHEQARF